MLINNKFYFLANGHFFSLHVLRFISLSCNFRKFYITSILFDPFQPSVVSYKNQSFVLLCKTNDWFLHETQHWIEMG